MTEHKSFKRLVRARMAKTGESYTVARAMLLRAEDETESNGVRLATSDERIRQRTGHGWEEWFEILDDWGAADRSHRETARWVADKQGIHPLAWNAQAVVSSYELTRGLREVGEKDDGFAITASKTVAVAGATALRRVRRRARCASGGCPMASSPSAPPPDRSPPALTGARGTTRVNVTFLAKGDAKSTVALEHRRLADAGEAERMKAYWRQRLGALKRALER